MCCRAAQRTTNNSRCFSLRHNTTYINLITGDYRKQELGTQVIRYALNIGWQHNCYKVMLLTSSKREETLHSFIAFPLAEL